MLHSLYMNPIKRARKAAGMTQKSFSTACKIHPQAVLLNEAGCYPSILPAIVSWLKSNGYNDEELAREYQGFVIEKRQAFGTKINFEEFNWDRFDFKLHPIVVFRLKLGLSRMGFAKAICIQPAFCYKLENGEAISLSGQIKEALLGVGFTPSFIEELNERCVDFANFGNQPSLTASL